MRVSSCQILLFDLSGKENTKLEKVQFAATCFCLSFTAVQGSVAASSIVKTCSREAVMRVAGNFSPVC